MKRIVRTLAVATSVVLAFAVVTGCSKTETEPKTAAGASQPNTQNAGSSNLPEYLQEDGGAAARKARAEARQLERDQRYAALPKADKTVPMSQYKEFNGVHDLLPAFYAQKGGPVDYEEMARITDNENGYNYITDQFKKRERLEVLKKSFDAAVTAAGQRKYYFMDIYTTLQPYNFDTKTFQRGVNPGKTAEYQFPNGGDYRLQLVNYGNFNGAKVEDEALARKIEELRTRSGIEGRVYFYVAGYDQDKRVLGEIVKMQLLDKKGQVLFEQ